MTALKVKELSSGHICTSEQGFTFIELVITVVILSILAIGSIQFVSYSASAYVQTSQRSHQSATASIINEKISRSLRNALPNSPRVNVTGSCIEFIPIISASQYIQAPIVASNNNPTELHVVPLDSAISSTGYGVIFPIVSNDLLYNNSRNPGRITTQEMTYLIDINGASIFSLAEPFQFEQASPRQRVYLVDQPHAFCQVGSVLFRYMNYGFIGALSNLDSTLPTSLPNRMLVASDLVEDSLEFSIDSGSLKRNNIVSYQYQLRQPNSQEILAIQQEVQTRNVP